MDHPEAKSPHYTGQDNEIGARVNQLAGRANRDSRMDNLVRQSDEITKMASIMAARAFQIIERLEGHRPTTQGCDAAEQVTGTGYITQLQDNFSNTRMSLESLNETLNELDNLV
jgi:hypothetical protein